MPSSHGTARPGRRSFLVAGVLISAIGALFYNLLPMYLGAAQDSRNLGYDQMGLIGSAFFLGYTLTSASAFFWIRSIDWRVVSTVSIGIAALGLLLGGGSESYGTLLASICLAGGGFGAVYSVGTTLLSDAENAARWYGAKITAEAVYGALLLFLAPVLVLPRWGFVGLTWAIIGAMLLMAPTCLWLPAQGLRQPDARPGDTREVAGTMPIWLGLAGVGLFMCGQTGIWGFVERLGNGAGFDPVLVGTLLAVSLLFAVSGSLVAAWLGNRYGCLRPLVAAHLVFFAGLAVLTQAQLFAPYAVGACLVMFSVGLGISYAVSTVAELDLDGRYVVLTVPFIGLGVMAGPGIAGMLASGKGYGSVLAFGAISLALSLAAFVLGARGTRAAEPGPAADLHMERWP